MKVQGPGRPNVSQLQDKGPVKGADEAKDAKKPPSERVEVSTLSKLLSQVRAPDAPDTAKVDRLRDFEALLELVKLGNMHLTQTSDFKEAVAAWLQQSGQSQRE